MRELLEIYVLISLSDLITINTFLLRPKNNFHISEIILVCIIVLRAKIGKF